MSLEVLNPSSVVDSGGPAGGRGACRRMSRTLDQAERPCWGRSTVTLASTITRPVSIYREEQNFGWWVYGLLALMAGVGDRCVACGRGQGGAEGGTDSWSGQVPLVLAVGLVVACGAGGGRLRMTTEVTPSECRIWFGWIPTFHHTVTLADVVQGGGGEYRPLADCGGWGIRRSRNGERVYNARGNRGVRVRVG